MHEIKLHLLISFTLLICLKDQYVSGECTDGDMKLEDAEGDYVGRVEICFKGVWGSICDEIANKEVALVVCKTLRKPLYDPKVVLQYAGGKGPIHLHSVLCTGTEANLLQCDRIKTEDNMHPYCGHLGDLGVSCAPPCTEGDIRLLRDRVQFCHNNIWGYICYDSSWTRTAGGVICQELGFSSEDSLVDYEHFYDRSKFPYYLTKRNCSGNNKNLTGCHWTIEDDNSCAEGSAAKVYCSKADERCNSTQLFRQRPLSETSTLENTGRLEMCYNGYWGTVCRDYTDHHVAMVACRELGYTNVAKATITPLGEINVTLPSLPIVLDDVRCSGSEGSLLQCTHRKLTTHTCVPSEDIVLECKQENWNGTETKIDGLDGRARTCRNGLWVSLHDGDESTNNTGVWPTIIDQRSGDGSIIGGVLASAFVIAAASLITVIIVVCHITKKRIKTKKLERYQRDIFRSQTTETAPDESMIMAGVESNDYSAKEQPLTGQCLLKVEHPESRGRLNSRYVRELTRGKFLIRSQELSHLEMIGQGEFGVVYKAMLGPKGTFSREVAVKTLKGCFDQQEVDKFVEESLKMSRFKHAHVMGLIGVCLNYAGSAPYIVMPYMANGCLLDYLKKERRNVVLFEEADDDQVQDVQKRLMVMCSQIASGMEYLAAEKYVHRDLAARNCMIDSHFVIKISDFGLSEDVFQRNYYREGVDGEIAKLPVKWMAPESLSDGHFSEKSDVWSFGVTMWEIFSGGKSPYPGTNPASLMQMLEGGERMPKPYNSACSDEIYMMMLECWESAPDKRPFFKTLYRNTSKFIEGLAGYLEVGFNPFATQTASEPGDEETTNERSEDEEGEEGLDEPVVTVNVIPPSFESGGQFPEY